MNPLWTRRDWITRHAVTTVAFGASLRWPWAGVPARTEIGTSNPSGCASSLMPASPLETVAPGVMQILALRAIDAARSAGAQYADVRLTRTIRHRYVLNGTFDFEEELVGGGVRVLVNGYWGFAASPYWTAEEVVRLAREAVEIATANAKGPARPVELGQIPVVTGTWATPVRIDPFTVPVEEKLDYIDYWNRCAARENTMYTQFGLTSFISFVREERVTATSEGSLVTQTLYESGGSHMLNPASGPSGIVFFIRDIGWAGKGWELFLDAKIPEQIAPRRDEAIADARNPRKLSTIGRYTLVCDGATMAALVGQTLGVATQLDRALGYEANAAGTSFLNDPLTMAGTFPVAAPHVTVKANRVAPAQLATVQWDDEGVGAQEFPVITNGIVVDFQTTREQAAWLAPYYQRSGTQVHSHGCAWSQDALSVPMQRMPNLELAPSEAVVTVNDMVANVTSGILVEDGWVGDVDSQAGSGLLSGTMREISNGRPGKTLVNSAVLFNTIGFWKHVSTIGGRATQSTIGYSRYDVSSVPEAKGRPAQYTSYSARAAAATITDQAVIDPTRKA